jgi:hypothetical protein
MEQLTLLEIKDTLLQPTSMIVPFSPVSEGFKLQYEHQNGRLYQGNSFDWLESLDDASIDLGCRNEAIFRQLFLPIFGFLYIKKFVTFLALVQSNKFTTH